MSAVPPPPRWVARLFAVALRLYPPAFRRRFEASLREAFRDRLADLSGVGRMRRAAETLRVLADLAVAAVAERVRPVHASAGADPTSPLGTTMDALVQDLRFALRSLVRRPLFALVAVGTLALGIGATTAVFSIVNGVLLRPLPYPASEELAMVWTHDRATPDARGWLSLPNMDDLRDLDGVRALEGWQSGSFTITDGDRPERIGGARVTGGLLELFGLAPLAGRDLRRDENGPGAPRVVVVSHRLWQDRLGGRPDAVGTRLSLNEIPYEVVGVAPAGFSFPDGALLWTPYRHDLDGCGRGCTVYQGVARLGEGRSPDDVAPEMTALATRLGQAWPDTNHDAFFRAEPLLDYQVGGVRTGLWVVLGAVSMVLLVVCANVANLLLARAGSRRAEVGLRRALGASRGRVARQVLTESGLLALLGGAGGVALAGLLLGGFRMLAPVTLPRLDEVALDGPVLLFVLGLTTLVALLFGLSPALHMSRAPAGALGGAARAGDRTGSRARSALIAVEVALALVLLVGAGLLVRSLDRLYDVDLGFTERQVVRFDLSLPGARYDALPEVAAFYATLEERLASLPGVVSVGSAFGVPLGGGNIGGHVRVEGRPEPEPGSQRYASIRPATPGYFRTLGIPLLQGRGVEASDRTEAEPVVVVNQRFVAENFPDGRAVGARIRVGASFGWDEPGFRTIVGVVGDVRRTLTSEPGPAVYPPHAQFGPGFLRVHVGARSDPGALVPALREQVRVLDPNLPLTGVVTLDDAVRADAASTRFYLLLVTAFAGVAAVLTAVGLYGVVAYLVARRTREIGIRLALGARRPAITGMVLRQGLVPAAWGLLAGLAAALAGGRLVEGLLFQVEPHDPWVLAAVTLAVLLVATAAILVPARRATRVDPTEALRAE